MAKKTFEVWFAEVNKKLRAATGLDARDLPDCPYYDWYDDGVTPANAAKRALRSAME